jgi:hypothetical protein
MSSVTSSRVWKSAPAIDQCSSFFPGQARGRAGGEMGMSHAALTEHLTGWELPVISNPIRLRRLPPRFDW